MSHVQQQHSLCVALILVHAGVLVLKVWGEGLSAGVRARVRAARVQTQGVAGGCAVKGTLWSQCGGARLIVWEQVRVALLTAL